MPCIDQPRSFNRCRALAWAAFAGCLLSLAGCGASSLSAPSAGAAPKVELPVPPPPRSADGLRLQAARRIVQANPEGTYTGPVPDMLLAIPVLEVELKADGSIRRIEVMRHPSQAPETTQLAIDAVRRAAPFGDVSHLPRPWKFVETFLFNEERRFKPRTLDR